ncbi:MAG: type II secretion system protein [Verrucomicrobiales bacterium]|nr:type II secretion system protein [Verrucomicrobiales bacterium]
MGGFTLTEALVVMGILAVLVAVLVPGLARAKGLAHAVTCRNHLRHWGIATQLYADGHEDRLPPEGVPNPTDRHTNTGWYVQLPAEVGWRRYVDEPWRTNAAAEPGRTWWLCPANRRRSNGRNLFHYCLNQQVDGTSEADEPTRLGSLLNPTTLVWLFDSKNLPAVGYWGFVHTNGHRGGAQILFLDGHTGWFSNRDYWDFEIQRGRTNHPAIRWFP